MLDNFSSSAQRMIIKAEELTKEFHHSSVGSEHLLLAILFFEDNLLSKELNIYDVKYKGFYDKVKRLYSKEKKINYVSYSLELKEVLEEAIKVSHKYKEPLVSLDILSLTLITLDNTSKELLESMNVNIDLITKKFLSTFRKKSDLHTLNDLHLLGTNNKDPLIGRDNEIIQLTYALSRRNKPNAILIGEPGVGKTAIVEELAKRLINNEVPLLKNKLIYELDLASTVSGTKYRGEFEDKLKKIIKKVKEDGNAILFIDEIHNVIKAGGAEGAIDASNILKPYLARGEIQLIGATTLEEFNDSFDKDKALKRRFQIIDVNESSKEETINILRKVKSIYEDYYSLDIDDSLLEEIVELSNKYLINQRFPDKAIELLDNSCVSASKVLTKDNVVYTINKLYGVNANDKEKINKLNYLLNKELIGNEETKKKIVDLFSGSNVNSLLFVGGKGTGKFKCSEIVSKALYNGNLITLKSENYLDINAINRLTSNGFSYSGEQSSILVKTLKERPNSVVLIENLDLANDGFKSFFQTILEKGYFLDSKGNKISTINALFIFTYTQKDYREYKFNYNENKKSNGSLIDLENIIGYSLYSLIDQVLCFEKLNEEQYKDLALRYLNKNQEALFEISDIPNFLDKDLENNGGDAVIYKVKELQRKNKIKNI